MPPCYAFNFYILFPLRFEPSLDSFEGYLGLQIFGEKIMENWEEFFSKW